ncbi:MAG: PAS domain S-box protein [Chloroflexi bacterium]|nr:PAS domain S-box protein [Chloroflexota bacterium]
MKHPVIGDKHFYILLALFVACAVLYYFGELVILYGWEALRWPIFYTIHDLQRMLFLVPVLYSSYYYRLRGAILANIISLLIFLPRAIFVAPGLETTIRTAFFVIMAAVFSVLTVLIFNQRDKQNKLMEAVKQSEEKNRVVLDQMYDSYYEVDLAGNFTFVNNSVCRNLGYSREELIGSNYRITVPDDDIKPVLIAFNEVFRTGAPNTGFAHGILCKDGRIIFVESSISLRKNEKGEIIGFRSISRDVTEHKQAEEDLRLREAHLRSLVNILQFDTASVQDFLDYALNEAIKLTESKIGYIYYYDEETKEFTLNTWSQDVMKECTIAEKKTQYHLEKTGIWGEAVRQRKPIVVNDFQSPHPLKKGYPEGHAKLYKYLTVPVFRENRIVAVVGVANKQSDYTQTDILQLTLLMDSVWKATYSKQAGEALRESEKKYRLLIENINDVFYTLDNLGNITYVSPVVERFTLYKVSDLIGKPFIPLIYPDDLPGLLDSFNRLVSGQLEPWEFRILDKDGRIIFVRTSSRPIYENGEIVGITALMTDITGRKQMEQKLEEIATHDFLTGLPNRVLLLDRFTVAAAMAQRNKARLAVMSLDLDKFKLINDVYGHGAGDQVLKIIGTRLTAVIRASDTLARIGGDEFVLVTMETGRMEDATAVAQKILDSFKEPLLIDGNHLYVSTSIGIAIYPEDGQDLETLTKKSDAAMYYSKGHGRNQFKFFSDGDV